LSSAELSVKKIDSDFARIENLRLTIGKIIEEEEWTEKIGPHPKPSITTLREWDMKIVQRYDPFYTPSCDMCCMCTFGKCDLTKNKRGGCGITIQAQSARQYLLTCLIGATCHAAHARHLVHHLIQKFGRDTKISLGNEVEIEAPITRLVMGIRPKKLGDLEQVCEYQEEQLTHLLASCHYGQEGSAADYESKSLHAGMLDNLALEVADLAQIVGFNFPKGDPNAPLVDIGMGVLDKNKPVILCIGHNVAPGVEIIDYLRKKDLYGKVEVAGICCTAHDITRYADKAKIIGPVSRQKKYVRSGIADVIVIDEQCVRTDIVEEADKVNSVVIATNEKICAGLPDMSHHTPDFIVKEFLSGKVKHAMILDPVKAAQVAVELALEIAPRREGFKSLPDEKELIEIASKCINCGWCRRACPEDLATDEAMQFAKKGDFQRLADLYEACVGCGRCEGACRVGINVLGLITKAAEKVWKEERCKIRVGRGPILDTEIRNVGQPIVMGEIPGVIAFVGCANYPNGGKEVAEMAEEFLKRKYIVVASGCAAMDIGLYKDEEGRTIYEKYPGDFDAGCIANTGSCVSNAHIMGAAIKIANIFARRPLRANYEEIADYILNRVGAVGVVWGAYSQKALSIGTGAIRLGIPVIVGPHGGKYRKLYLGRKELKEKWMAYDARTGDRVYIGPAPEHLSYAAETKEEAIVMAAKLCMKPNDTFKGRQIKLTHYIDFYRKYYGKMPDDIDLYVRVEGDIPITMKDEIMIVLKEKGWKEQRLLDPTLLKRLIREVKS
jgi:acetyl-CoA decarbonylase/synthase complex subunit alpha